MHNVRISQEVFAKNFLFFWGEVQLYVCKTSGNAVQPKRRSDPRVAVNLCSGVLSLRAM